MQCMGKFGRGLRNSNGQKLVEFCDTHNLVATNTFFQHKASHRTTWVGHRQDTETGKTVPIYNQIDLILTPKEQINLVTNARSYSGTSVKNQRKDEIYYKTAEINSLKDSAQMF